MVPLAELIASAGIDPRVATLEQVLPIVSAEASSFAGRAMASVKLGKNELLVTVAEAKAAFASPETVGDRELTARTLRAGENALVHVLAQRGFYDERFAGLRIDANTDLDRGEVSLVSVPSPTRKRQAGRPSRSVDFAKMLARDVHFRLGAGEASSIEKVVELLTGRDRNGNAIVGVKPSLVMPNSRKSHRTIMNMLRSVAEEAPTLEAMRQGEMVKAGGAADPEFYDRLMQVRAILSTPAAVRSMLRSARRKN